MTQAFNAKYLDDLNATILTGISALNDSIAKTDIALDFRIARLQKTP